MKGWVNYKSIDGWLTSSGTVALHIVMYRKNKRLYEILIGHRELISRDSMQNVRISRKYRKAYPYTICNGLLGI